MSAEPVYERFRPPPGGFTADDLDQIPDFPPHTELIDGSLVFGSPQKLFHMKVLRLLEQALALAAPTDRFRVRREMSAVLGPQQRSSPSRSISTSTSPGSTGSDVLAVRRGRNCPAGHPPGAGPRAPIAAGRVAAMTSGLELRGVTARTTRDSNSQRLPQPAAPMKPLDPP